MYTNTESVTKQVIWLFLGLVEKNTYVRGQFSDPITSQKPEKVENMSIFIEFYTDENEFYTVHK